MRDALADIANTAEQLIILQAGDTVLDIGCNDGTLLSSYKTTGIISVGFDPAENLAHISRRVASFVVSDFFTKEKWEGRFGHPKIITSIAMFYDLEDPNQFVSDVKAILHPDGVWVVQMSYLPLMLKQHDFGNICHEHLEYYSLRSLENLLQRHKLKVVDVDTNNINGGSFRVFIRHKHADGTGFGDGLYRQLARGRARAMRIREAEIELGQLNPYLKFATWVERIKSDVYHFIWGVAIAGKKVAVYGASTKGNVMLQYFGLDHELITCASERNSDKWGLETVGTRIPIVSEEEARAMKPDYMLVLPWHFMEEFREREKKYLFDGGKFIVPLPHFTLI
jgi:hypothetical protein